MSNEKNQNANFELWNDEALGQCYQSRDQAQEHILEQYKVYLELTDRISHRRDVANGFFLALNGVILGAAGALIEKSEKLDSKWLLVFPAIVLFLECFFWWRLIFSYKQLNGAKFRIVGKFEERLPVSLYAKAKWNGLLKGGNDRKAYWPLTHLEANIPIIFAVSYALVFLWLIVK